MDIEKTLVALADIPCAKLCHSTDCEGGARYIIRDGSKWWPQCSASKCSCRRGTAIPIPARLLQKSLLKKKGYWTHAQVQKALAETA